MNLVFLVLLFIFYLNIPDVFFVFLILLVPEENRRCKKCKHYDIINCLKT